MLHLLKGVVIALTNEDNVLFLYLSYNVTLIKIKVVTQEFKC